MISVNGRQPLETGYVITIGRQRARSQLVGQQIDAVLLRNNRDGTFSERTRDAGVGRGRIGVPKGYSVGWGTAFFDYDNDGDQDLYLAAGYLDTDPDTNPAQQPNALFRNDGDGCLGTAVQVDT